jgi:DNA-binding CsgD family transcriptional regulator/tetratricopeptide (TPR) repeat protein
MDDTLRLRGRRSECEALDRLVANVRAGQSRVLVLRGEAGAGKTALLEYLVQRAPGFRIVRAAGAEPEMEIPFAGLHQLCAPFLDRLGRLPNPQRDALETAFSLRNGDPPDRFAVGLAALSLLSEPAGGQPLVCVVDDTQWLDLTSARVLAFVARHLAAAPVAMVFAVRQPGGEQDLTGLPELLVGGLADGDARALLDSVVIGPLDERVRDRIVAETRGNPQALLEWSRRLIPGELAGGFGLPSAVAPTGRIEEGILARFASLPESTRLLLVTAAADPTGDPVLVWRAAGQLGVEAGAAAPATAVGLIEFRGLVRFCHPLARAAVYWAASPRQRQHVHRALADATDPDADPDRRAWHLAHTVSGLDEGIAAELDCSADRARARGGLMAAAAFAERAAELTSDPDQRAWRALTAAQVKYQVGAPDATCALLAMAQAGPLDELGHARAELLRAQLAADPGRRGDAWLLLLKAASRLEPLDARLAREAYRDALMAALTAGRLATGDGMLQAAEAAWGAPQVPEPARATDLLLYGLVVLTTEGHAAGMPIVKRALNAFRSQGVPVEKALRWLPLACRMSRDAWDDDSWYVLSVRLIELARQVGALTVLPVALLDGAAVRLAFGEPAAAASLTREAAAIARVTGSPVGSYGPLLLAAWTGREAEAAHLITAATPEMMARGEGQWLTTAAWATALLYNGLGRYDQALAAAERGSEYPPELGLATWSMVELIEAAVRTGAPERAAGALRRLSEAASTAATDWALGIEARSRALLSDGEPAERLYLEAVQRLGRTRIRAELARAHLLYGEWLRRQNRRTDAREQLRAAYEMLTVIEAEGFAERARRELLATGETVRKRMVSTAGELTAQEAEIARLAGYGHTNPEISTKLFISPRTVEWHLRKVFRKLGISSRRELRKALPDLERVPLPT